MNSTLLQLLMSGMAPGGQALPGEAPRPPGLEVGPGQMGGPSPLRQALWGQDAMGYPLPPQQDPRYMQKQPPAPPGGGMTGGAYRDLMATQKPGS